MGTGQLMLTIGAMMLLTLVILRVNNGFLTTNSVLLDSKFGVLAVSLATSVLEEANSKSFDENSDSNSVSNLLELTSPASLGPEGEVYPNYNDFDDYDGFTKNTAGDTTLQSAEFDILCAVDYITPANPDGKSASRTWHKKLTVTVTSPSMNDTIVMSAVYSYWYFR